MSISFLGESFYAMAVIGSIFRALAPPLAQAGVYPAITVRGTRNSVQHETLQRAFRVR